MHFRLNPTSGVPIYLQLMEQIKHAVETGALHSGDQLPGIRTLAGTLVMNPHTVAKAYRELQHEGLIEVRHGSGAFVAGGYSSTNDSLRIRKAQGILKSTVERLISLGMAEDEMRRLFEYELLQLRENTTIRTGK